MHERTLAQETLPLPESLLHDILSLTVRVCTQLAFSCKFNNLAATVSPLKNVLNDAQRHRFHAFSFGFLVSLKFSIFRFEIKSDTDPFTCFSAQSRFNSWIVNLIQLTRTSVNLLGDFSLFVFETVRSSRFFWKRRDLFLRQCEFIGVNSLGITLTAGVFMGAVIGYQLYVSLHRFGAEGLLGGTVGVSLFRELGPVMSGIMVTGRAGAAMAAEISSMRISEQIDALEVMAVDPVEYLVAPRVIAGLLMMPLLAIFFVIVGSLAASGVACGLMGLQTATFWSQYWQFVDPIELVHCLVKSATFGLVLTWIGCFCGFRAHGGAKAVGEATRNTVVATCLTILLSDYFLTSLLPIGFKTLKVR